MTLAILGTGGQAKSVFDIVQKKKIYFFDNDKKEFHINTKKFKIIGSLKSMIDLR